MNQTGSDSVTDYLVSDHRRLDGLMGRCLAAIDASDMSGAASSFEEFRVGLTRHIKIEEGLVFQAFEAASGLGKDRGPTGVMRSEHEEILRQIGALKEHFAHVAPEPGESRRLCDELISLLGEHNAKEERVLYPTTDSVVEPARLRELVRAMKAF